AMSQSLKQIVNVLAVEFIVFYVYAVAVRCARVREAGRLAQWVRAGEGEARWLAGLRVVRRVRRGALAVVRAGEAGAQREVRVRRGALACKVRRSEGGAGSKVRAVKRRALAVREEHAAGVALFGKVYDPDHGEYEYLSVHANFSNFLVAFLTLLRISTGESFNGLLHELRFGPRDCTKNCGSQLAVPYMISFNLFSQLLLLNIVTAVLMDTYARCLQEKDRLVNPDVLHDYVTHWSKFDPTARSFIPVSNLFPLLTTMKPPIGLKRSQQDFKHSELIHYLQYLNVPLYQVRQPSWGKIFTEPKNETKVVANSRWQRARGYSREQVHKKRSSLPQGDGESGSGAAEDEGGGDGSEPAPGQERPPKPGRGRTSDDKGMDRESTARASVQPMQQRDSIASSTSNTHRMIEWTQSVVKSITRIRQSDKGPHEHCVHFRDLLEALVAFVHLLQCRQCSDSDVTAEAIKLSMIRQRTKRMRKMNVYMP
ncbi:hypothetical protein CYMTET_28995, partial [Cymbomonas tetramitiformis]